MILSTTITTLLFTVFTFTNAFSFYIENQPIKFERDEPGHGGFRERGLKIHNYFRRLNNARPLELDQELNKLAHFHAENLASLNTSLTSTESGFQENLWSHRGELLPLAKDVEYAVKCWYTGSTAPGHVTSSVDFYVLRSNFVKFVGFGVGTKDFGGEGYTVVVALYQ